MSMKIRWSRDRRAAGLVRAVIGILVFVVARWVLERTPFASNIPDLLIVGASIFFATVV
jgi:hypothetical protein